jgi:hypothetical protein
LLTSLFQTEKAFADGKLHFKLKCTKSVKCDRGLIVTYDSYSLGDLLIKCYRPCQNSKMNANIGNKKMAKKSEQAEKLKENEEREARINFTLDMVVHDLISQGKKQNRNVGKYSGKQGYNHFSKFI